MTFDWAIWSTPLMVLAAGAVVGAGLLMRHSGDPQAARAEGDERDLEQERKSAVIALKALEMERHKMEPEDYERERQALLTRGASALRTLDTGTASEPSNEPQAPATPVVGNAWRGALYASAAWALVAGLIWFAQQQSFERREGGSMTGGTPSAAPMAAPQQGPNFRSMAAPLEARVAQNPKDVDALNELTQISLSAGDAAGAMKWNQQAYEADPGNDDATVYKGVMAAMVGLADRALTLFDEVIERNPEHPRAVTYKGLLLLEQNRGEEAVPWLEKAVALQPGNPALQTALARAKGEPAPAATAPQNGPRPSATPTGGDPGELVVRLQLSLSDDAASAVQPGQLLFVSVRDPAGGPPLAAKRITDPSFPMTVEIRGSDAIAMGGAPRPFPPTLSLSARLDGDGNAMTREDLPQASQPAATKGSDLSLTLE